MRPNANLMVDCLIKILDENIALSSLAQSGIALRPHDAAKRTMSAMFIMTQEAVLFLPSTALNERVIEPVKSALAVSSVQVVDVGIAKGATSDGVAADTDAAKSLGLDTPTEVAAHTWRQDRSC